MRRFKTFLFKKPHRVNKITQSTKTKHPQKLSKPLLSYTPHKVNPYDQGRLKKKKQKKEFFVPKETWTHGLCCLADCTSKTVSSRTEMLQLQSSDLGRK